MRPSTAFPARLGLGLALALFAGCQSATQFAEEATWPVPRKGAAASEHPLATAVGLEVLDKGGNAADAAVAMALTLAVVYPQAGNLGGGGFALWVPHSGKAEALDFRECAPLAADAARYLDGAGKRVEKRSLEGALAVAVPGTPAGLEALLLRHGSHTFTLAELCEPAIRFAHQGFAVDAWLARDLAEKGLFERMNPPARERFFPGGRALADGELLRQPELAETLAVYATRGASGFYRGRVAEALVAEIARTPVPQSERTGEGWITLEDLARYAVIPREPLTGWFRGQEILTLPPPSSGGLVLLQTLGVLEGLPLDTELRDAERDARIKFASTHEQPRDHPALSERMLHWWIEALRGAFADRAEHLGDPDFPGTTPVGELLSPSWIAARRVAIGEQANPRVEAWQPPREGQNTTHLSVLDAQGNAVALTTTLNQSFGSGVMVREAGFLLNDEMDDFALQAGSPNAFGLVGGAQNALAPRKRPLSSMAPTVVREGGHTARMVLGSPGGPRIITAVTQVLLRALLFGQSLEESVRAPRMHQQWNPAATEFEPEFDPALVAGLESRRQQAVKASKQHFGSVQAIEVPAPGGLPIAVSDPRRGGAAGVQGQPLSRPALPPADVPGAPRP